MTYLLDFRQLEYKEETIIGDKGVTLSGGQRARVSLARALYSDADIYLFDDPLSAVDASVGRYLFDKYVLEWNYVFNVCFFSLILKIFNLRCINEYLNTKIRVLITHQVHYLHKATKIIVLNKVIVCSKHSTRLL